MDLRKYKEKQFFVGTAFWRIVWVTETGADFAVDNGKKKEFNIIFLFCHWVISTIFAAGLSQSRFSYSFRFQVRAVNGITR